MTVPIIARPSGSAANQLYLGSRNDDEWAAIYALLPPDGRIRNPARLSRRIALESRRKMRAKAQRLINGVLSPEEWYSQSRNEIKTATYATFILQAGSPEEAEENNDTYIALALLLLLFLDNFLGQLIDGTQPFDGTAISRAGLYGLSADNLFHNAGLRFAILRGKIEARRNLGPTEDHCHDTPGRPGCIELAALGWVPIRSMVPIGGATCYSNCLCTISYR